VEKYEQDVAGPTLKCVVIHPSHSSMLHSVQVISSICWIIWKYFITVITVVTFAHCSFLFRINTRKFTEYIKKYQYSYIMFSLHSTSSSV